MYAPYQRTVSALGHLGESQIAGWVPLHRRDGSSSAHRASRVGRLQVELEAETRLACGGEDERGCGRVLDCDPDGLVQRQLLRRRASARRAVDELTKLDQVAATVPVAGRYAGIAATNPPRSFTYAAIRGGIEARPALRSAIADASACRKASGSSSDFVSAEDRMRIGLR